MDKKTLKIEKVVYGGKGFARQNGKVHFVPFTAPGDVVKAICIEKGDYGLCNLEEIIEPSQHRRKPICRHFKLCGGCHLQHIVQEYENDIKRGFIEETLRRLAGKDVKIDGFVSGRFLHYRNKVEYSFFKGRTGFHRVDGGPFPMEECFIEETSIKRVREKILHLTGVRKLILRTDDTGRVFAILKGSFNQRRSRKILREAGVYYSISPDSKWNREEFLEFSIEGLNLVVSPFSFFQVNTEILRKMAGILMDVVKPTGEDVVVDAYAGVGTFGFMLSRYVREVRLIEESHYASKDAEFNRKRNYIENVRIFRGRVEEHLDKFKGASLIVLDPPREGLNRKVIEAINTTNVNKIVYISCNPATLSRDLKHFDGYSIASCYGFNMFPLSYHVETMIVLEKSRGIVNFSL